MKADRMQQLLLKDKPLMEIYPTGKCVILDFDRLPFALRKESVSFVDFMEWASNRTLSMGRSYAKEILNAMRLSQTNRYAVCRACRGLSLEDSYWIRQDGDEALSTEGLRSRENGYTPRSLRRSEPAPRDGSGRRTDFICIRSGNMRFRRMRCLKRCISLIFPMRCLRRKRFRLIFPRKDRSGSKEWERLS